MRIRMLTSIAGHMNNRNFSYAPGEELDMDDNSAMRLIASKQAESVVAAEQLESRTAQEFRERFKLSPARYLELYPTGPNAHVARAALA